MNRTLAKLITATGILCSMIALCLYLFSSVSESKFSQILLPLVFVGGIVLIFFSLAYYTEK